MHNPGVRPLFLFLLLAIPAETQWWRVETSGIDSNLRGVSIFSTPDAQGPSQPVVWASGSNGVVLRSIDGGKTWQRLQVPGGEGLDFRGVQAVAVDTAYLMSIGAGEQSRIYKTTDAGRTWLLQFTGDRAAVFLDAIQCLSPTHCFAVSDPVDGKFLLLTTEDGAHWRPLENPPNALPNEGVFAASNSSLVVDASGEILFATGGPAARVFRSGDFGRTWSVHETPIAHASASAGIFSLVRLPEALVIVGGDYKAVDADATVAAYSMDHGASWHLSADQPGGFRSAVGTFDGSALFAVGSRGTDFSYDQGAHWVHTDALNLNALAFAPQLNVGWAVGPHGTIARFENHRRMRPPIAANPRPQ
jgi:photosystem II stability/assembly factor-like uncharacterized protein